MELGALAPSIPLLAVAVALDALFGDPQVRWHPIRLVGSLIVRLEALLRRVGAVGRGGGIALGLGTTALSTLVAAALVVLAAWAHPWLGWGAHALVLYSMLALRDLVDHAWRVEEAVRNGSVDQARHATSLFVARDTASMDVAACRRCGIESLAENYTDGFLSPLFWYVIAGIPGIVAFKAFSTLDSMVGNKSDRYIHFGWFSARTDDVLNWFPARLSWPIIAMAALLPGYSARSALVVGWQQHAVVPGPNSGWSEASFAGALERRLVGPIYLGGKLVTEIWIGRSVDPPAGELSSDMPSAIRLVIVAAMLATGLAFLGLWVRP